MPTDRDPAQARTFAERMVAHGVRDPAVLAAMAAVPRAAFVPPDMAELADLDGPLPIGEGQTISQPSLVALMVEAAAPGGRDRVLEVGAGSGYAAAILSRIAARVFAIERHAALCEAARERLARLGHDTIALRVGDGSRGWPEAAPFDAILVSAGGPAVPAALKDQLVVGGRLVMPVGGLHGQRLLKLTRRSETAFDAEDLGAVRFVPLVAGRSPRHARGDRTARALSAEMDAGSAKESASKRGPGDADLMQSGRIRP